MYNSSVIIFYALVALAIILWLSYRLYKAGQRRKAVEARLGQLEYKTQALQLETLEAKLNPHLFKNILNAIQSHAYQTYFAMDKLANVLDYILYESRDKFVSPKEEIDFALNLIEINKIKISPLFELNVKTRIDETHSLYQQKILAPLISIDLIENAFKHADLQSAEAFINIIFEFRNGTFSLFVSNRASTKPSMAKEHGGFGNESLMQRLQIMYKDRFKLERFLEKDTYFAHLKIDLS